MTIILLPDFTVDEIKSYMGFKKVQDVKQAIEIVKLMDEYLTAYDYEGIYTQIPSGAEDRLLKLNDAIKRIKEGGIPWIPTDGKDEVITDLKTICFDFIRLGEHNQEEYRAIMQGNYSFLANEAIWRQFVKSYFDKVDEVPEEASTEEVLETSKSDEDSTRLLRARDNKWKSTVKEVVSEAYTESKISLENNKDKDEPLKLLKKAINALSSINHETIRTAENKAELVHKVEEILELIKGIKKDIE